MMYNVNENDNDNGQAFSVQCRDNKFPVISPDINTHTGRISITPINPFIMEKFMSSSLPLSRLDDSRRVRNLLRCWRQFTIHHDGLLTLGGGRRANLLKNHLMQSIVCLCLCVCVSEREMEREKERVIE